MKVKICSLFLLLWVSSSIFAQINSSKIYIPHNVKVAYEKGTRAENGMPGENYWQNSANYDFDVEVFPENGLIKGEGSITYYNNSPDALKQIVLRFYPDIYKKGNARQFGMGKDDLTDGMQLTRLHVQGKEYEEAEIQRLSGTATNRVIRFGNELEPGESMKIELGWEMKLPQKRWIRMGHYNADHMFVAYWYPQVAVYDDIDGWDMIDYLGFVEFYNDFNDYTVKIKVPEGFAIWATGELKNPEEVYHKKVVKNYYKALESDEVVNIIERADYDRNKVFKTSSEGIWKFEARDVPDFSFAVSSYSNWDAASFIADSSNSRRVLASAVYPNGMIHWDKGASVARECLIYMSNELPGYPYPYPHSTSFSNSRKSGGMETPMMANNGSPADYNQFVGLMFHEILHSYFPFYMGTNERKYAFMDEGWAAYLPTDIVKELANDSTYLERYINSYLAVAGKEIEIPLMTMSYHVNNYTAGRTVAYSRPAVAYHMLKELLGDDLFKKGLLEFMNRWKGKHPIPNDFFNTYEDVAGEDLDWFWLPWFYEKGYPDLAISTVNDDYVLVDMAGNFPVPVKLKFFFEDGSMKDYEYPLRSWKEKDQLKIGMPKTKKVIRIELGDPNIPDLNKENNSWILGY